MQVPQNTVPGTSATYPQVEVPKFELDGDQVLSSDLVKNNQDPRKLAQTQTDTALARRIRSEHLFRIIGNAIPFGVWVTDNEGVPSYVSETLLNLTGSDLGDFRSNRWFQALHPNDRRAFVDSWTESIRHKDFWDHEYRIIGCDGCLYTVVSRGSPIHDREGRRIGWAGVTFDMTGRRRAEDRLRESEESYRTIVDLANEGIWKIDESGRTRFTNRRLIEMLTSTDSSSAHRDLLQSSIWDFLDTSSLVEFEAAWFALKDGKRQQFDCAFRRTDGTLLWALVSSSPLHDQTGQFIGSLHLLTDVSARRTAEEELKRAMTLADDANRAKSQFLANMSHEIRTPLGAVLGFAELLLDESQSTKQRAECVTAIKRNGDLLLSLINDILDLSKVEAGRLDIEAAPFSLLELITEVKGLFQTHADAKGLVLQIESCGDLPQDIVSDSNRLRQILFNVIGNAVKFTSTGRVHARFFSRHEHVVVHVHDTGPGIRPEDAARLFTPFTQADTSITRKYGGTGLGLVLSRNLARALGGDVVLIQSSAHEGSLFEISIRKSLLRVDRSISDVIDTQLQKQLQNSIVTAPCPSANPAYPPHLENVEILMVDDSEDSRLLLQRLLQPTNAILTMAENGEEGLRKALDGRYDVVLMDIQMPVMDGYEATRRLRAKGYRGPIVALTAHAMKEERTRCLAAGCTEHVVKPVTRQNLLETIARVVRQDLSLD